MSLTKCKECENMVSSEAKTCPHCGAKLRKSIWRVLLIIILFIMGGLFFVSYQRGSSFVANEKKRLADEARKLANEVANEVKKHVEHSVKEGLTEEIGARCISVALWEAWENKFVGDAKLEDGRELDITASANDGGQVRYAYIFKQGYEYKCKHHIDQVSLRFNEPKTHGTLNGRVWNDESHPIKGICCNRVDRQKRSSLS